MKTLRNIITQYPLMSFFIMTYALSWWSAPFTGSDHTRYYLIFVGLACLTAVFLTPPKMGKRHLVEAF
jgi:hypothetical protein